MEEQMVEQRDDGRNEMQQAVYDKLTKTIKNVKGVPTEVPESTAANFLTVFREDTEFAGVKYNEMAHRLMTEDDDGIREWTAVDDATSRRYIEQFYRLTGQQKQFPDETDASLKEKGFYTEKNKERLRQGFVSGRWYTEDPKK